MSIFCGISDRFFSFVMRLLFQWIHVRHFATSQPVIMLLFTHKRKDDNPKIMRTAPSTIVNGVLANILARRKPLFVSEFDAALLTLNVNKPSSEPLFQLPPIGYRPASNYLNFRFMPPINLPISLASFETCSYCFVGIMRNSAAVRTRKRNCSSPTSSRFNDSVLSRAAFASIVILTISITMF